jgi:hypothetical protein
LLFVHVVYVVVDFGTFVDVDCWFSLILIPFVRSWFTFGHVCSVDIDYRPSRCLIWLITLYIVAVCCSRLLFVLSWYVVYLRFLFTFISYCCISSFGSLLLIVQMRGVPLLWFCLLLLIIVYIQFTLRFHVWFSFILRYLRFRCWICWCLLLFC